MTDKGRSQKYYKRDNSYSRNRSQGYHRDFKNQRHKRRSKEKDYLYDEDEIFHSEIEKVHKILQTMSQETEMAIGFMLATSDNPEKFLDSIHSQTDVNQLIAERVEYAKSQKIEDAHLMQDSIETEFAEGKVDSYYTEITGNSEEDVIDFHRINVCNMVELQDLPYRIVEVDMQDFPTTIVDELELWELIEIPGIPIRFREGQVLEEFMLEEEIEFQDMDKYIVELPDKQELERCVSPEMSVRIVCEQEEFIKEEVCNKLLPELPELYRAQESINKDDIQLEIQWK